MAPQPDAAAKPQQVVHVLPDPEVVHTLTKKELIDHVVEASGIKKKFAKPAIEATLRALGEALSRGDTLNLQPLGKGIVKTRKALENAEVVEIRLRRSKQSIEAVAKETIDGVDLDSADLDGADADMGDAPAEAAE